MPVFPCPDHPEEKVSLDWDKGTATCSVCRKTVGSLPPMGPVGPSGCVSEIGPLGVPVCFTLEAVELEADPYPVNYTAEDILGMLGFTDCPGIRALHQYFAGEKRRRYWPLGWNDKIHIQNGDAFTIEYGDRMERP